jgi:hypothetical protein
MFPYNNNVASGRRNSQFYLQNQQRKDEGASASKLNEIEDEEFSSSYKGDDDGIEQSLFHAGITQEVEDINKATSGFNRQAGFVKVQP